MFHANLGMFLIKNTERLIKEASEQFKDEKCVFCPVFQSAIDLKPWKFSFVLKIKKNMLQVIECS